MRRPVQNYTKISSHHGDKTNLSSFGRHLGCDYACPIGNNVVAPVNGVVTMSYMSAAIGNTIEIREDGNGRLHRICHLGSRKVNVGQRVAEGQLIGISGNTGSQTTGPHVHWDIRKANTVWNASFSNYYDPEALLAAAARPNMPAVGSKVQLVPRDSRTTYKAGTTAVAGKINVTDNSYIYIVRGYDSKYPGRILINSASAGGNGVALALYYTNGRRIDGWKQI